MIVSKGYSRDCAKSLPLLDKSDDVKSGEGFDVHVWVAVDGHALAWTAAAVVADHDDAGVAIDVAA